eukprot:TRINITY_DN8376_c0_g1_i1.p1 TRINITY_DN8376_c0_g1~~TRINITY_DN8376_c0_g1_i1.p1  ORF type:complete len:153 (-),score=14.02 TRINITY_DN8376_c0_g1_i1:62-520(-)
MRDMPRIRPAPFSALSIGPLHRTEENGSTSVPTTLRTQKPRPRANLSQAAHDEMQFRLEELAMYCDSESFSHKRSLLPEKVIEAAAKYSAQADAVDRLLAYGFFKHQNPSSVDERNRLHDAGHMLDVESFNSALQEHALGRRTKKTRSVCTC